MAVAPGYKGVVTSWAAPNNAILALWKPMRFAVSVAGDALEGTGFAAGGAVVRTYNKGLRSWTGQIEGYPATPVGGHLGTFSGSNVYVTNPRSFEITIEAGVLEDTAFQPTNNWRVFQPGLLGWQVQWE